MKPPKVNNENIVANEETIFSDSALIENLQAGMNEKPLITNTESFNPEEEEKRNKLIAHYSKLFPWIYYVLEK